MSDGIKLNQGVVTSLATTDLVVAADSVGSLRPISFANLMQLIRDNIKIGGRNLLKGANSDISSNNQIFIGKYEFGDTLPVKGETYTLSLCYSLKGTSIRASLFGGEIYNPFTFTTNGERIVEQKTMIVSPEIPSYITSAKGFHFYRTNIGDSYPAIIHWAVLTKGNLGVVDWSPAPEDLWGGGKTLRYNQLQIAAERRAA